MPTSLEPAVAGRVTTAHPVAGTVDAVLPPGFPDRVIDCVDCYLRWVDLSGANLHGADLRNSDLSRANLQGADLSDADLRGADLTHARLADVDLSGARWVDGSVCATASIGRCRAAPPDTPITQRLATASIMRDAAASKFILFAHEEPLIELRICKWYGGKRAAISLTYDSAYGTWTSHPHTAQIAAKAGLPLNHEIVTSAFEDPQDFGRLSEIHTDLLDRNMHVYGHGHRHVDHDQLSYAEALASLKRCYELMDSWGLRPRAYAYPHSAGLMPTTQQAARDAGFICARGSTLSHRNVQICPDDVRVPDNWFYLPAVSIARDFPAYVNDTQELVPILEETLDRRAWVILMYHAIGTPNGWGFYPLGDFYRDVKWIESQDFWGANMDDAAAYIYERNALQVEIDPASNRGDLYLVFDDDLDDAIYDQPLSIEAEYVGSLAASGFHVDAAEATNLPDGAIRFDVIPDGQRLRLRLY